MSVRTKHVSEIVAAIQTLVSDLDRPPLVAVTGFGGAGKSTLAARLCDDLPDAAVVPGDEFMRTRPPVGRSDDWADLDRDRLLRQVVEPGQTGAPVRYQVYDPEHQAPGPWLSVDGAGVIIVEGLALLHPDLADRYDLTVWVDVDLDIATEQGMWRDRHVFGNPQVELWEEVWKPNDAGFHHRYRPDLVADLLFTPR